MIIFVPYFKTKKNLSLKKLLVVSLFTLVAMVSFGQDFMGIKVEGKRIDVINQFKSKGFYIVKDDNPNVASLKGNVSGRTYEVSIVSSPISHTVWKIVVYLPEITEWYSLKSNYETYLKVLTEKYGEPEKTYHFFSSPYTEGDGYEMTGVFAGKCNYVAYWPESKGISIEISKWKQVKINYENPINSVLDDKEKSSVDVKIF